MGETRRMHYVPKTYLKNFSEKRGNEFFIYAVSKKAREKVFPTNITNICVEKDLYTLPGETESSRQFIEKMYSDLYESDYDNIYKLLIDESKESLTTKERYSIVGFVVSMFYRNNSWNNFHNKFMDEVYAKGYHLTKANGKESFFIEEQEINIVGRSLEELQKENHNQDKPLMALTALQKMLELTRMRFFNDVIAINKTSSDSEFITSDNPVSFRNEEVKRPIPVDPTNTLSIPIDSNHLLQLRSWGHELDKNMIGRLSGPALINMVNSRINNEFQLAQSDKFILGTKTALHRFLQRPINKLL